MPSESPTRIRSMPASTTRRALGKSYAVSIASRAPFLRLSSRTVGFMAQACEIEQLAVEQVRRAHVGERAHDRLDAAGMALFPLGEHLAHHLPLQVFLRAAQVARNDRESLHLGVSDQIVLAHVRERADHHVLAVVRAQLRRHRLELATVEQVEKKGREDVVAVMAERDLGRAELAGGAVQRSAPQPRAERAHRLALGAHALHHRVGILLDNAIRHLSAFEILGQHVGGKARLLLVHVHRQEIEPDRRFFFEGNQNVEKRMTILAPREADHDPVARLDHVEVADRLAHLPAQALGKLVVFVLDFASSWNHRKVERPPSTARICPVTKGAQARKCTASATSSGEPMRPSGVVARMRARSACSNWPSSGQAMAPGATPFTRTSGASSSASERVSAASPALAMLYTG